MNNHDCIALMATSLAGLWFTDGFLEGAIKQDALLKKSSDEQMREDLNSLQADLKQKLEHELK